jgi:hypothetical protein
MQNQSMESGKHIGKKSMINTHLEKSGVHSQNASPHTVISFIERKGVIIGGMGKGSME